MMPDDQLSTFLSKEQASEPEQPTEKRARITINRRVIGSGKILVEWQKQLAPAEDIPRSPLPVELPTRLPSIVETPLPPTVQNTTTHAETSHLYLSSNSDPRLPTKHLHTKTHEKLIHYLIYPLKLLVRFWRFSRTLCVLSLLILLISGGLLEYIYLNQHEYGLFQVDTTNGDTQWQQILALPTQPLLVDTQGSIVVTTTSNALHQLSALDRNGKVRWTSFSSKEIFSIPFTSRPGTILVMLSEPPAPASTTSPILPSLHSELTLYLLNRETGRTIWQYIIIGPNQQEYAQMLGTDTRQIYVASRENNHTPLNVESTAQLTAIDLNTGKKKWQALTFLNTNEYTISPDVGKLLLRKQQLIWQVTGTLYSIATSDGSISWHRFIGDNYPAALPQIEDAMAETAGILLVERSNSYHALDVNSGQELWNISNSGSSTPEAPTGVLSSGHFFLVYNENLLETINTLNGQVIWSQKQLGTIQSLKISDDGSKVFVVLLNSTDSTNSVQVLVAIDTKTGAVLWTFEPFDQASFAHLQSDGFQYFNGTLFVSICLPDSNSSCARERFYAINGNTGAALWKVEANSIFDVLISSDGRAILFLANTSEWNNLIGRFRA